MEFWSMDSSRSVGETLVTRNIFFDKTYVRRIRYNKNWTRKHYHFFRNVSAITEEVVRLALATTAGGLYVVRVEWLR